MPAAIRSLAAHLGDGDPLAWRAALRVFEQAFGRPMEMADDRHDPALLDPLDVASLSAVERGRLMTEILRQHPRLIELVAKREGPGE